MMGQKQSQKGQELSRKRRGISFSPFKRSVLIKPHPGCTPSVKEGGEQPCSTFCPSCWRTVDFSSCCGCGGAAFCCNIITSCTCHSGRTVVFSLLSSSLTTLTADANCFFFKTSLLFLLQIVSTASSTLSSRKRSRAVRAYSISVISSHLKCMKLRLSVLVSSLRQQLILFCMSVRNSLRKSWMPWGGTSSLTWARMMKKYVLELRYSWKPCSKAFLSPFSSSLPRSRLATQMNFLWELLVERLYEVRRSVILRMFYSEGSPSAWRVRLRPEFKERYVFGVWSLPFSGIYFRKGVKGTPEPQNGSQWNDSRDTTLPQLTLRAYLPGDNVLMERKSWGWCMRQQILYVLKKTINRFEKQNQPQQGRLGIEGGRKRDSADQANYFLGYIKIFYS